MKSFLFLLSLLLVSTPAYTADTIIVRQGQAYLQDADGRLWPAMIMYGTDGNGHPVPPPGSGGPVAQGSPGLTPWLVTDGPAETSLGNIDTSTSQAATNTATTAENVASLLGISQTSTGTHLAQATGTVSFLCGDGAPADGDTITFTPMNLTYVLSNAFSDGTVIEAGIVVNFVNGDCAADNTHFVHAVNLTATSNFHASASGSTTTLLTAGSSFIGTAGNAIVISSVSLGAGISTSGGFSGGTSDTFKTGLAVNIPPENTVNVAGPLTNAQLRASAVLVSGPVTVTGVATAANQTNGAQKAQRVDASGNVAPAGDTPARRSYFQATNGAITQTFSTSGAAVQATATISATGTNNSNGDTVTVTLPAPFAGTIVYTFKTSATLPCDVQIGANQTITAANWFAVIDGGSCHPTSRLTETHLVLPNLVFVAGTDFPGTAGNALTFSVSQAVSSLTPTSATFSGGTAGTLKNGADTFTANGALETGGNLAALATHQLDGTQKAQLVAGTASIGTTLAPFATRADIYTTTGNGVTVDVSAKPLKTFSLEVDQVGGVTSWDVRLECSLNGTSWTQLLQHTNVTPGDGQTSASGAALFPCLFIRSRVAGLVLGGGTSVTATILGVQ